jgi:hypothetical protein
MKGKSLRDYGLHSLERLMPEQAAAAWQGMRCLTSLEVDTLMYLQPAVKQLPSLVELFVRDTTYFPSSAVMQVLSATPQLQVLRLPAHKLYEGFPFSFTKEQLDGLSAMQQLQRVDDMRVNASELTHVFAMNNCYPSLQVVMSATERGAAVSEWMERGGGKQVRKLTIVAEVLWGTIKPSMSQWSGLKALQTLVLTGLDLTPGLQQLRGLKQLKKLEMKYCSPFIYSLEQLPPGLCDLSLRDNLRENTALHEQQQQQQVSSTSQPQLPHLTRLILKGDSSVSCAGGVVAGTPNLQQLVLDCPTFAESMLIRFTELTALSALTLPYQYSPDTVLQAVSVLDRYMCLRDLTTSWGVTPLPGLEVAQYLKHITSFKLVVQGECVPASIPVSGGLLEVSVSGFDRGSWKTWAC